MPIHICKLLFNGASKIVDPNYDFSFDVIPAKNNSDISRCVFTLQKHQDNFTIAAKCLSGCECELNGDVLTMDCSCVFKHLIEFHTRSSVQVVVKAPHRKLLAENKRYIYQLPVPGFEDITFKTEFERLHDGHFGVWIFNRWSVKINGCFGNYAITLCKDDNFVNVLHFEFDPDVVRPQIKTNTYRKKSLQALNGMKAFEKMRIEAAHEYIKRGNLSNQPTNG